MRGVSTPPPSPQKNSSRPVYDRSGEHASDALRLLERLRQAARDHIYPSTSELTEERLYGLRPPNRINDLVRGRYNGVRYDIERLACGHGVYRWRLHEAARPGYPKSKNQTVLPLEPPSSSRTIPGGADWYEVQTGRPRGAVVPGKSTMDDLPLFQGVRS